MHVVPLTPSIDRLRIIYYFLHSEFMYHETIIMPQKPPVRPEMLLYITLSPSLEVCLLITTRPLNKQNCLCSCIVLDHQGYVIPIKSLESNLSTTIYTFSDLIHTIHTIHDQFKKKYCHVEPCCTSTIIACNVL